MSLIHLEIPIKTYYNTYYTELSVMRTAVINGRAWKPEKAGSWSIKVADGIKACHQVEVEMEISLKAARVNRGYTQKEAAQRLGISVEALRRYEKGKSLPGIDLIKRMEEVFGISYDNLRFSDEDRGDGSAKA